MTNDPMVRRRELRDSMSAKTAQLLERSRRSDANGGRLPGVLDAAMQEPDLAADVEEGSRRPTGDIGAGRGVGAPDSSYRGRIREAEETGDVRRSIHLKTLQLRDGFDPHHIHVWD